MPKKPGLSAAHRPPNNNTAARVFIVFLSAACLSFCRHIANAWRPENRNTLLTRAWGPSKKSVQHASNVYCVKGIIARRLKLVFSEFLLYFDQSSAETVSTIPKTEAPSRTNTDA